MVFRTMTFRLTLRFDFFTDTFLLRGLLADTFQRITWITYLEGFPTLLVFVLAYFVDSGVVQVNLLTLCPYF